MARAVKCGLNSIAGGLLLMSMLTVLTNCSDISSAVDDTPSTDINANYRPLIIARFKAGFKDYATFNSFEISAPRLVHSIIGPVWLACVRFETQGNQRYYVYSIKDNAIVAARYAVQTDECGKQSYVAVDLATGAEKAVAPVARNPLY